VLSKPASKPIKLSVQWVPDLSWGKSSCNVVLITHFLLVLGFGKVGAILPPLLCVFIGMSYLYIIMKIIIYRIDNIYK